MIPDRLPAQTSEKAIHGMAPLFLPQIHLFLEFDGPLDPGRLARAFRLCLDAEPVLGCRFVPRGFYPFWERLPAERLDREPLLRQDPEPAAQDRFLTEDLDPKQGPQLRALLTRGERGDRLILKASHTAVDAGGTKEIGYLLAVRYRRLQTNPGFEPDPNLGSRSLRQVYRQYIPFQFTGIMRRFFRDIRKQLKPFQSLNYPSGTEKTGHPVFLFRRFDQRRFKALQAIAGRSNATLNDLMVAALLRALARQLDWNGKDALRLIGTADLRRYLPGQRAAGLCNLSSFYFCNFGQNLGENLDDTVNIVKEQLDPLKNDYIGLGFILGTWLTVLPYPFVVTNAVLPRIFSNLSRSKNMPPAMTNMGKIDDESLDFGEPKTVAAELATPPNLPPMMVTGLSGFKDTLTLSTSFYESAIPREKFEDLFDLVEDELGIHGLMSGEK
jgi:NRPS condensation-like uncharacterized protein